MYVIYVVPAISLLCNGIVLHVMFNVSTERIRMVTSPQDAVVLNNTVINRFFTGGELGSGIADREFTTIGSLNVDCRTSQGDHNPVWSTSSEVANTVTGLVSTVEGISRQVIGNYTARYVY